VISKIRITGLGAWPDEAEHQLTMQIHEQTPDSVIMSGKTRGSDLTVHLSDDLPNLKREQLRHDVQKTLAKAEHDHGLTATLESIEETDADERDATFS